MTPSRTVFAGLDASGNDNLWVTDGTSAGTTELSVSGAYPSGLYYQLFPAFVVVGSKALFAGKDTNGHVNLWVTDGTSGGTSELTVAGIGSLGLEPSWFTVLGGKVLFSGWDTSGHRNLWVTDGTSAGTSELTITGIYLGVFDLINYPKLTVLGNQALFAGSNPTGYNSLWVADGTSAGTREVPVYGAYKLGVFTGVNFPASPSSVARRCLPAPIRMGTSISG